MARIVDPVTGGLSFECREDLSPEFDIECPAYYKWGFDLPKEVDFHVVLSDHGSASSFAPIERYLKDGVSLYLCEGIIDSSVLEGAFDELCDGVQADLEFYIAYVYSQEYYSYPEFMIEKLRSVFENKTPTAHLDPPKGHKIHGETVDWYLHADINDMETTIKTLSKLSAQRDKWALNNLKKIVDGKAPYIKGERRQVLISRGFMHLGLLRALEYACWLKKEESGGTEVVSSVAIIPPNWNTSTQKRIGYQFDLHS